MDSVPWTRSRFPLCIIHKPEAVIYNQYKPYNFFWLSSFHYSSIDSYKFNALDGKDFLQAAR